jgi:hypothetical protein
MISLEERALLYVLARDYYSRSGMIVDAGCFLGGSTLALAQGVLDRDPPIQDPVIETFDRFKLDKGSFAPYAALLDGLRPGDSLRPAFDAVLSDRLRVVNVREGDIRRMDWSGGPIEVLFIDLAKNWSINDHVARTFFPALIPGRSVVIQQDYVHEWTPCLHITMELLGDAFDYGGTVPSCSAIFTSRRNITADDLPRNLFRDIPHDEKLALYDRSVGRFAAEERGVLECGRAYLLHLLGDTSAAHKQLDHVGQAYKGPRVETILPQMREVCVERRYRRVLSRLGLGRRSARGTEPVP